MPMFRPSRNQFDMEPNDDYLGQLDADLGAEGQAMMQSIERTLTDPVLNLQAIVTDAVTRFATTKLNMEALNDVARLKEQMSSLQQEMTIKTALHQQEITLKMQAHQEATDLKIQDLANKLQSHQQESGPKMEAFQNEVNLKLRDLEDRLDQMAAEPREALESDSMDALRSEIEQLQDDMKFAKEEVKVATNTFAERWNEMQGDFSSLDETAREHTTQLDELTSQVQQVSSDLSAAVSGKPASPATPESSQFTQHPASDESQKSGPSILNQQQKRKHTIEVVTSQASPIFASSSEMSDAPSSASSSGASDTSEPQFGSCPTPTSGTVSAIAVKKLAQEFNKKFTATPPPEGRHAAFLWRFLDRVEREVGQAWSIFLQQELQQKYPEIIKPNPRGNASHYIQLHSIGWPHMKQWLVEHISMFKART